MKMTMNTVLIGSCLAVSALAHDLVANTIINLTQDSAVVVRDVATYTYYSRAGSSSFSTAFYPGTTLTTGFYDGSLAPITTGGAAISFKTGELTSGSNKVVSGWQGAVSSGGNFDIVFDLGANYVIDYVVITYADYGGHRWSKVADAQQIYLSTSAPSDANTTLFASATFSEGTSTAAKTAKLDGVDTIARYVDFRAAVSAGSGSNFGGDLYQIAIYGYSVPEASSLLVLASGGLLLLRRRGV